MVRPPGPRSAAKNINFDYRIDGWDVDPQSVQKASRALYSRNALAEIPTRFHPLVLLGSGKTEGLLTVSAEIRERCNFEQRNLLAKICR